MKKVLIIVLFLTLAGNVFAQRSKHGTGDINLGIDLGFGFTPGTNIAKIIETPGTFPSGNHAMFVNLGLRPEYYVNPWLSLSSGVGFSMGWYAFLDNDFRAAGGTRFEDVLLTPTSITVPVMAHINAPFMPSLYFGTGINLNFPLGHHYSEDYDPKDYGHDPKGSFFWGIPIDIGFDFMQPFSGGMRLVLRVTPEFHSDGVVVPVGIRWQIYNFRLRIGY